MVRHVRHGCRRPPRRELARDGVDTVLIRNQIDPLPTSGVDQEGYLASVRRQSVATDREWSDALRAAGLRVYQTTALFFDPELLADRCPTRGRSTRTASRSRRSTGISASAPRTRAIWRPRSIACDASSPSWSRTGSFLSFTRYPGFWENWVPGYTFTDADRFCFCPRCRARFARRAGDRPARRRCRRPRRGSSWTSMARRGPPGALGASSTVIERIAARFAPRSAPARDHAQHLALSRVRLRRARRAAGDRGAGSGDAARTWLTASS